jgi:hypothetical protein
MKDRKDFCARAKNVHFRWEESEQHNTSAANMKAEALAEFKKAIKVEGEFRKVPLGLRIPDRTVCIGVEAGHKEQAELLAFLDKNSGAFAWSTSKLIGISEDIIEHRLHVNPSTKPKEQKLRKISDEKVEAAIGRRLYQRSNLPRMATPNG